MTTLLRWQIGANAAGAGHWATVEPENVAAPTLYFALIENRSFRTGQNSGSQFNRSINAHIPPMSLKHSFRWGWLTQKQSAPIVHAARFVDNAPRGYDWGNYLLRSR
jgi:hypothetical protein